MLKQLLLATCMMSTNFAADDGLGPQSDSFGQNSTEKVIIHTDCIDPTRKVHTTTSFMELCGNVYFRPEYYLKDLDPTNKETPLLNYFYDTNYVRSFRIWCDGHPDTLVLYVNSLVRGLDDHNYYLMRGRAEISSCKLAPEAKEEFTLSFKKDGSFNCIDPGQPTQSARSLTIKISSEFNDYTDESSQTNGQSSADRVYSILFDLKGLTSHKGESEINVNRFEEE